MEQSAEDPGQLPSLAPSSRGGVFISHVHEDEQVADALAVLVQDITAGAVQTFSSSSRTPGHGIRYGDEWFQWIRSKIELADHVVALLTPSSLGRPWILFEAGLGKAQPSGSVFGLAVGVSVENASAGPFGVFQNSGSDQVSLIKLCRQLIEPSALKPRDEVVGAMVDQFLGKVSTVTSDPPLEDAPNLSPSAIYQALEDLKFLIRDRPSAEARDSRHRRGADIEQLLMQIERGRVPVGSHIEQRLLAECASELELGAVAAILRTISQAGPGSIGPTELALEIVDGTRPVSRTADMLLHLVRRHLLTWRDEQRERLQRRARRTRPRMPAEVAEESAEVATDAEEDEDDPDG